MNNKEKQYLSQLEQRVSMLEQRLLKMELSNNKCDCSWDYVVGSSGKYYCAKCDRPMRG